MVSAPECMFLFVCRLSGGRGAHCIAHVTLHCAAAVAVMRKSCRDRRPSAKAQATPPRSDTNAKRGRLRATRDSGNPTKRKAARAKAAIERQLNQATMTLSLGLGPSTGDSDGGTSPSPLHSDTPTMSSSLDHVLFDHLPQGPLFPPGPPGASVVWDGVDRRGLGLTSVPGVSPVTLYPSATAVPSATFYPPAPNAPRPLFPPVSPGAPVVWDGVDRSGLELASVPGVSSAAFQPPATAVPSGVLTPIPIPSLRQFGTAVPAVSPIVRDPVDEKEAAAVAKSAANTAAKARTAAAKAAAEEQIVILQPQAWSVNDTRDKDNALNGSYGGPGHRIENPQQQYMGHRGVVSAIIDLGAGTARQVVPGNLASNVAPPKIDVPITADALATVFHWMVNNLLDCKPSVGKPTLRSTAVESKEQNHQKATTSFRAPGKNVRVDVLSKSLVYLLSVGELKVKRDFAGRLTTAGVRSLNAGVISEVTQSLGDKQDRWSAPVPSTPIPHFECQLTNCVACRESANGNCATRTHMCMCVCVWCRRRGGSHVHQRVAFA
jgi:hypothetical protein